jgi:predicted TIM-barrel fold metal-dependent hydrolase
MLAESITKGRGAMLNLDTISLIDNHCHPVLRVQQMDVLQFRGYFSEATHPDFAQRHIQHTVYYLWLLRQLAQVYDCNPVEEEIIAARNSMTTNEILQLLLRSAGIKTLIFDVGHPEPERCVSPEQLQALGYSRSQRMLRLEILMQQLVNAHDDFATVEYYFRQALMDIRGAGYCALKSIVAYRTGLALQRWSTDEAVRAFREARAQVEVCGTVRLAHKPLIDYLLHIAFQYAAEQAVPVQFHTGYGDHDTDLLLGNPLHLRPIFEDPEYQTLPIVLLHESYPYTRQGAYLAALYPQVYFDLSYSIPFVDRGEMVAFTRQALGVASASKLLYSSDGIFVPEMHWASARRGRSVLAQVLQEMVRADELDEEQAYHLARLILHDTAARLYRV